jgi:hypothetical protein
VWQFEQISTWISACGDRVWNVFPQEHVTVAST